MDCPKRKIVLPSAIVTIVILLLVYSLVFYKPSITTATYEELDQIYVIGHERATDILNYCELNKNATVDDIDNIEGIGDKTVSLLKERWK